MHNYNDNTFSTIFRRQHTFAAVKASENYDTLSSAHQLPMEEEVNECIGEGRVAVGGVYAGGD